MDDPLWQGRASLNMTIFFDLGMEWRTKCSPNPGIVIRGGLQCPIPNTFRLNFLFNSIYDICTTRVMIKRHKSLGRNKRVCCNFQMSKKVNDWKVRERHRVRDVTGSQVTRMASCNAVKENWKSYLNKNNHKQIITVLVTYLKYCWLENLK